MNFRDLKYLIAIDKHRHFSKAAASCFVSQPTLSAQLKKLENELGVQLFERNNKHILTTPAGEAIVAQARHAIRDMEEIKVIAETLSDPLSGTIKLGIISTLGPYLLPHVISEIHEQLPKLQLLLIEEKTETLLKQLKEGSIDAVILTHQEDVEHYVQQDLFTEPFYVACSHQHVFNKKTEIAIEDLYTETILLLNDGHCLRDDALGICPRIREQEKSGFQATSLETLRHMVAADVGVTLLPALSANTNAQHSVVCVRPFKKPYPQRQISILWRKLQPKQVLCRKIAEIVSGKIKNYFAVSRG